MSSFLMGYPHHLQSMGINIEPKFPPSDEYGFHSTGYNNVDGISQTGNEYLHQTQHDVLHHNNSYQYGMSGHYYHHHNGYVSPAQMHLPGPISAPAAVQPSQSSNSTPNQNNGYVTDSTTYYSGYYSGSGHHMDVPLHCPGSEVSNTALGLQELGKPLFYFHSGCDLCLTRWIN